MPPLPEIVNRRAQNNFRVVTAGAIWRMLETVTLERSQDVRSQYANATANIVAAGQRQAAMFAAAWVGASLPPVRDLDLDRALAGRLMTPESDGAIFGLLRLWSLLDSDVPEAQAREQAGSLAGNFAGGDLIAAEQAGLDEGADASGERVRWAKRAGDDACAWCREVAGDGMGFRYHSAETVPKHRVGNDKCGFAAARLVNGEWEEIDE